VERKKGERYSSQEFRFQAVQKMKACNNVPGALEGTGHTPQIAVQLARPIRREQPWSAPFP
jgi:hypothetical protein